MDMTESFERCAQELWELYNTDFTKPIIAVAGSFNTGKSTLINNLLGTELSPVDVVPTTACPIYFHYDRHFAAQFTRKFRKIRIESICDYKAYLKDKNHAAALERIDLWWPAELLKKCILVDTPGIDSIEPKQQSKLFLKQAQRITEQVIAEADKVFFIFHQRGINEYERNFLWQVKPWWEEKGRKGLFLWISCNLQGFDGTSLDETRSAAGEIFGPSIQVHTLNTQDNRSIKLVRQLLEYELAGDLIGQMKHNLKELDASIPHRLKKLTRVNDEILFLTSFWEIQNTAELILNTRQSLDSIPRIMQKIRHNLQEYDNKSIRKTHTPAASAKEKAKTVNLADIKEKLTDLLRRLMFDPELRSLINPKELGELAGRIRDEEFLVLAAGPFSSGKTTFFNAIMQDMVLPAENKPTTACITRIKYGKRPQAEVYLKHQTTLPIYEVSANNKGQLRRVETQALRQWLEDSQMAEQIAKIEADTGEGMITVNSQQLSKLLQQTTDLFNSEVSTLPNTAFQRPLPALVRLISVKKLGRNRAVRAVRLTFQKAAPITFDLEGADGRSAFYRYLSPANSLRTEEIHIYYPAELLKLASFIDTPGFDSTYKHHRELTGSYLSASDAYLLFLNGKHILTNMDRQNILQIMKGRIKEYLTGLTPQQAASEADKFFVVINFADTLSATEKEKVVNYVRQNLYFEGHAGTGLFIPQVYLISSLSALIGDELWGNCNNSNEGFQKLIRKLERTLLKRRGEEILQRHIVELRSCILTISNGPKTLIQKYLKELNHIERLLGTPGGVQIWKMQGH